ncbi:Protein TAR1 [Quillaja saponaria]|uniref:Protein TAR1 n=1 Tax=Quillaja saponaria TaxID=32244 RepID=A0AAD7P4E5_QUISA|nr:Protein TAR1 [Quillaja saponaria]
MGGGAWPFLVGGAICLVNSVNERDLSLLTSYVEASSTASFLEGLWPFRPRKFEAITERPANPSPLPSRCSGGRPFLLGGGASRQHNEPRRNARQGNPIETHAPAVPETVPRGMQCTNLYLKRLSATDISALASMKNVAKCDTWCELQNPVNHRVFERKLRPRPSGRGHVCLGVTHRCPDPLRSPPPNWGVVEGVQGRTLASREPRLAAGPNKSPRWQAPRHAVVEYRSRPVESACCRPGTATTLSRCAQRYRSDPRSGGATR